jgi:plastocyanin
MLSARNLVVIAIAVIAAGCQQFGKSAVPETSRTANVHTVKVSMTEISPSDVTVGVGDEILFVNDRTQPVRIILIEGGKSVACQRNFSGTIDQEAEIASGRSASFCFDRPGTVKYMVRSKGGIEGAETVLPAQIQVQGGTAAAPVQARDRRVPTPTDDITGGGEVMPTACAEISVQRLGRQQDQ